MTDREIRKLIYKHWVSTADSTEVILHFLTTATILGYILSLIKFIKKLLKPEDLK